MGTKLPPNGAPAGEPESAPEPRKQGSNASLAIKVFLIAGIVFALIWYLDRLNG